MLLRQSPVENCILKSKSSAHQSAGGVAAEASTEFIRDILSTPEIL